MEEERIALFLDYENLALGARDHLTERFDFKPVADALAERGRVIVRRAYADWALFGNDRKDLTRHHVELIEIPQRMRVGRKNAADIKLAVDAVELALERDYITTFVIGTGDSDFTPLLWKLRELNRRVIGLGIAKSTSDLVPPACDEFLFYDRIEGVGPKKSRGDHDTLQVLITRTLAGLTRNNERILASNLKRTLMRKDPTFDEGEYGFRTFTELLGHLQKEGVVALNDGAQGDPEVALPTTVADESKAFELLEKVVKAGKRPVPLSGMKDQIRKIEPNFTEKVYGYSGFLQFAKAAETRGVISMTWSEDDENYKVALPGELSPDDEAPAETKTESKPDKPKSEKPVEVKAEPKDGAWQLDDSDEGETESKPAAKKTTRKRATRKKPATAKADSSDDKSEEPAKPKRTRSRAKSTAKKKTAAKKTADSNS